MTKELEGRIAELEQQLTKRPRRRLLKTIAVSMIAAAISASLLISLILLKPWQSKEIALPSSITSQADFPIYFFTQNIPGGYKLDEKTVSYSQGVLSYLIRADSNRVVAVTQQKQPADINAGLYPKAESVSGVDGDAVLSFNGTRSTGALFSNPRDDISSLVFLNGNDNVRGEDVKQLLRELRVVPAN